MPKAFKSWSKSNKSPDLVTLPANQPNAYARLIKERRNTEKRLKSDPVDLVTWRSLLFKSEATLQLGLR